MKVYSPLLPLTWLGFATEDIYLPLDKKSIEGSDVGNIFCLFMLLDIFSTKLLGTNFAYLLLNYFPKQI